jgi:hypothetical protein
LQVVYPDIKEDLNTAAERHTTAVGIDPTQVAGPRFVLNIRVPPPPKMLFEGAPPNAVREFDDPNYDEWEENWQ